MKIGLLAFAFGVPATILSNRRIAQIATQRARQFKATVYTQLDIQIEGGVRVEFTGECPGHPPPTLRFARGAIQWAKDNGLEELWVVAARPHLWRCVRDLNCAIQEARAQITINVCEEIEQFPEEEWFCADSTQKWTQSRKNWERRERVLRRLPLFIYKLIGSTQAEQRPL